jgi:exodeoxyribonuclease V alpha subunit
MGSVFKDMCDSGQIKVNYLTKVYRQSLDSYIVRNAYNIQQNKDLELSNDFKFFKINDFDEIEDIIKDLDYEYQVLCPMRVGKIGTITINQLCQRMLNGKEENKVFFNGKFFKVGDKVIQLDNNYNKEVYNGELGVIKEISSEKITVFFENNNVQEVDYLKNELYQLDLAYAISIHKSQGSEADHIILVVDGKEDFLSKELIYTAITRAKKTIILISKYDLDFYKGLETTNNRLTNLNNLIKSF